jgi:hypothetical protein
VLILGDENEGENTTNFVQFFEKNLTKRGIIEICTTDGRRGEV